MLKALSLLLMLLLPFGLPGQATTPTASTSVEVAFIDLTRPATSSGRVSSRRALRPRMAVTHGTVPGPEPWPVRVVLLSATPQPDSPDLFLVEIRLEAIRTVTLPRSQNGTLADPDPAVPNPTLRQIYPRLKLERSGPGEGTSLTYAALVGSSLAPGSLVTLQPGQHMRVRYVTDASEVLRGARAGRLEVRAYLNPSEGADFGVELLSDNTVQVGGTKGKPAAAPPATPRAPAPPPPPQQQEIPARSVARLYPQLCANCHGPTLEGGQAPSLLDDTWSFGGDDASIAQSIREGRPGTAMVSFKAALTDQEIRAFVIFIREEADKAKRRAATAGPSPPMDTTIQSEEQTFKIETIAEGLDTPWGIAWLPDGRMLVTERAGRVRIIDKDHLQATPVAGVPPVWVKQDGGLMDIAVHPQFASPDNGWIYLSFSELGGSKAGMSTTKIVRARLRDSVGSSGDAEPRLVDLQVLFQAPAALYWDDNTHFGSRFLFDTNGHLFYSIGDRGHQDLAQDLGSPYGKLHRIYDDGRVPEDNPFVGKAGAVATIWSYGHRNQQGLVWHPVTGELWSTEHGPRGGDELNVVERGKNYGWPVITYGMNYDGTAVTDKTAQEGMEQPIAYWTPSIATSAIEFYTGDRFPRWKHDLFLAALAGQELRRLRIDGHTVTHQEVLFKRRGRVRDVATGPDGYLYVALNEPGRIVRLVPAPTVEPTKAQPPAR